MTTTARTATQKAADTVTVFEEFRDQLTSAQMRDVLSKMTGAQMVATASSGDVQAYAALVEASLRLQGVVSSNDRAAMLAAAIVTQSGVVRPVINSEE